MSMLLHFSLWQCHVVHKTSQQLTSRIICDRRKGNYKNKIIKSVSCRKICTHKSECKTTGKTPDNASYTIKYKEEVFTHYRQKCITPLTTAVKISQPGQLISNLDWAPSLLGQGKHNSEQLCGYYVHKHFFDIG